MSRGSGLLNRFSERLKSLREGKSLSQDKLGKELNVSRYAIYTYEKGKACPTVDGLIALADYFDVSLDYLVGRTDEPAPYPPARRK